MMDIGCGMDKACGLTAKGMSQCLNAEKPAEKNFRSRMDTGGIFGSYWQDQSHSLENCEN